MLGVDHFGARGDVLLVRRDLRLGPGHRRLPQLRIVEAEDTEEYLEFRVAQDAITGDIDLVITEFVNAGDEENTAAIWDAAVDTLKYTIGG